MVELTTPLGVRGREFRRSQHYAVASSAAALLGVALVLFLVTGQGQQWSALTYITPPTRNSEVVVTTADVNAINRRVHDDLHHLQTEVAGSIRGSRDTSEVEATAIIGNMDHYVRTMGEPYASVTGSHSDDAVEADAIIDTANAENMDITGKAGATLYKVASDPSQPATAWLRGSIPNYRAESAYITSGVNGNYEKELENAPTMSVVGGQVSARDVASRIVDAAYEDPTSPDCTGSVDASGVHGVGKGTPPCVGILQFRKPKTMAGTDPHMSKIWVNITLNDPVCDDATKDAVQHVLAQAAGTASTDVFFVEDEATNSTNATGSDTLYAPESSNLHATGEAAKLSPLQRKSHQTLHLSIKQRAAAEKAHDAELERQVVAANARAKKASAAAQAALKREKHAEFQAHAARAAFDKEQHERMEHASAAKVVAAAAAATPEVDLEAEVDKVQGQLAKLQKETKGMNEAGLEQREKVALKGDSVFERKLAAAALKLELSQSKLLKPEHGMSAEARYKQEKAEALGKDEKPFYWLHTPAADEKAAPAQLKQTPGRRLLQIEGGECRFEAWISVPNSAAFDARINVLKKTNLGLVAKGMKQAIAVSTKIQDIPPEPPTVRLVDCSEGCCRVEIFHDDVWGTVCDDTPTENRPAVAEVACKQAGCSGPAVFKTQFGGGTGNIWLDDVMCVGGEEKLEDCPNSGAWGDGNDDCGHSEDMGVCCTDGCTGA